MQKLTTILAFLAGHEQKALKEHVHWRLSARLAAEASLKNDKFLQSIFIWILGASMIWKKRTL